MLSEKRGQSLSEYALLLGLVAVVAVLGLRLSGLSIAEVFTSITNSLGGIESQNGLLYSTSFDNGLDGWSSVNWKRSSADNWTTEDGQASATRHSGMVLDDFLGSDFIVKLTELDLDIVRSTWHGASVFFRADNSENVNGYAFRMQRPNANVDGDIYFSRWENGYQIGGKLARVSPPPDFDWEGVHDVEVRVSGNQFTAYVDGVEMLTASDDTYSEGTVGFYTHSGSTATLGSFDVEEIG